MFASTAQTNSHVTRQSMRAFQPAASVQSISMELYQKYRDMALSMINPTNPEINYIVKNNSDIPGASGYGLHEKFIHYGRSVIDLSVGELHFPWVAADADPRNEISATRLQQLANQETNPLTAGRLRKIANFASWLPSYTRIYYYKSADGSVKSVTLEDEMNQVKFNMIVSYEAL